MQKVIQFDTQYINVQEEGKYLKRNLHTRIHMEQYNSNFASQTGMYYDVTFVCLAVL